MSDSPPNQATQDHRESEVHLAHSELNFGALKIDHLGIAVPELASAIKTYETLLGRPVGHEEIVQDQKVKTAFFEVGESAFELLEATDETSPIARFLKRNPHGGLHHVCVRVDDIEATLARYREAGVRLIDEHPRRGAHDQWVAFVHPKATGGVLLELAQSGPLASESEGLEAR